jgi:hypothetical protein
MAFAELLSLAGEHSASVQQLERAIRLSPGAWDVRLCLVDELRAAGQTERAIAELRIVQTVLPDSPAVHERAARLLPAEQPAALAAVPGSRPGQEVQATFARLLAGAEDLPQALEDELDNLNAELVTHVRGLARAAQAGANNDEALALTSLGDQIELRVALKNMPEPRANETYQLLLEAADPAAELAQRADQLDFAVLALVLHEASLARSAQEDDLAEGLHALAEGVADTIKGRRSVRGGVA